ncbi:uncharacterized protein LOC118420428 [Branchiostoma floridae]|uniref:Uncharacterized protein LOC118420428 n=1 Tax=Branchiostoma floridae TaxID=7739 RepID=A0A9J7LJZ5_BRAFL|nr:uncharacterized protein LOC118420428 [Branchiostoma floridae]
MGGLNASVGKAYVSTLLVILLMLVTVQPSGVHSLPKHDGESGDWPIVDMVQDATTQLNDAHAQSNSKDKGNWRRPTSVDTVRHGEPLEDCSPIDLENATEEEQLHLQHWDWLAVLGLLGKMAVVWLALILAQKDRTSRPPLMTTCILPNGVPLQIPYHPKRKVQHVTMEAVKTFEADTDRKYGQYQLVHDGWCLPENSTLANCSVFANSTVFLNIYQEGGQPETLPGLRNSCLSKPGQFSCAIDSFLELFYCIYKQFPDFRCSNNLGPLLSKVASSCKARARAMTQTDVQGTREQPWAWAIQNVRSFAGRTAMACVEELFHHITGTEWERKSFALTKTLSRCCRLCNYAKEDNRVYCPLLPTANMFEQDKSLQSAIRAIVERGDGLGHCLSCNAKSIQCHVKEIELPDYLFVEVPYVPQGGRNDNLCGIQIEHDISLKEMSYTVAGCIRAKPGHFTAIIPKEGRLYELDDMRSAPVREGHSLASILSQEGDTVVTAPGSYIHIVVYKQVKNVEMKREVNIAPDNNPIRVPLSSVENENSVNGVWRPWLTPRRTSKLAQSNTHARREPSTRGKENAHLLPQREKPKSPMQKTTPQVDSVRDTHDIYVDITSHERDRRSEDRWTKLNYGKLELKERQVEQQCIDDKEGFVGPKKAKRALHLENSPMKENYQNPSDGNDNFKSGKKRKSETVEQPIIKQVSVAKKNGRKRYNTKGATSVTSKDEEGKAQKCSELLVGPEKCPQGPETGFMVSGFLNGEGLQCDQEGSIQYWVNANSELFLSLPDTLEVLGLSKEIKLKKRGYKRIYDHMAKSGLESNQHIIKIKTEDGTSVKVVSFEGFYCLLSLPHSMFFQQSANYGVKRQFSSILKKHLLSEVVGTKEKSAKHGKVMHQSKQTQTIDENTTVGSPLKSTSSYILALHQKKKNGKYVRCTTLEKRIRLHQNMTKTIAEKVHMGCKQDFLQAIAFDISTNIGKSQQQWQGALSLEDIQYVLDIATKKQKTAKQKTEDTALETLAKNFIKNSNQYYITAQELIYLADNFKGYDLFNKLREKIPFLFASRKEVDICKQTYKSEFHTILCPERTATGWKICPKRLLECLSFLYYYLPKTCQNWKLYGDARTYGRKATVMLGINNIDNEQMQHGIKYHSTKHFWPFQIFYGKDNRINLETNVGDGHGRPGFLDKAISELQENIDYKYQFYLTGDSPFLDSILAEKGLGGTTDDGYNIYMYDNKDSKGAVSSHTGLRSGIPKMINRSHQTSLIPSIPIERVVFDIDHAITRIVEKLITLRIMKSVQITSLLKGDEGIQRRNASLAHLKANLNSRAVKSGLFEIHLETNGSLKYPVSFNKSDAYVIICPPEYFEEPFVPILQGVSSTQTVENTLPTQLREASQIESSMTNEFELETKLYYHMGMMYVYLRHDSNPTKTHEKQAMDENDTKVGLSDEEVEEYKTHADIFHGLFCHLYGGPELTPYMMKMIDVVPLLVQKLPCRSMMRFSTEGPEHVHYMHMCFYYSHTPRGGGRGKPDTILMLFQWIWRNLRYLITIYKDSENPEAVKAFSNFSKYIKLHIYWNRFIAHCRGYLQRQVNLPNIKNGRHSMVSQNPPTKKPLENHTFLLSGRMPANCGKKQDFIAKITENGGRVMDKIPPRGVSVDITVLTTQKEIDKGTDSWKNSSRLSSHASRIPQPNEAIVKGFQRKWNILSYQYALDCIKQTTTLDKNSYILSLDTLEKAPSTCLASAKETLPESLYFGKGRSAITQLRRKMKENKTKVPKVKRKGTKRLSVWGRFVSKESQKLKGTIKKGNCIQNVRELSKRWKALTSQEKKDFKEEARQSFEKRQDLEKSVDFSKISTQDHQNRTPAYRTAITGLTPLMHLTPNVEGSQ